jgi:hypothetical protein
MCRSVSLEIYRLFREQGFATGTTYLSESIPTYSPFEEQWVGSQEVLQGIGRLLVLMDLALRAGEA